MRTNHLRTSIAALSRTVIVLALTLAASSVHAATIAVTTTADVVALDGQCSLREAVTAANTNLPFSDCPTGEALPTIDVVELPVGTYALTLAPIGEDANAGGDLDILEAVTLRGLGEDFVWWDDPLTPDVETLDVFNSPDGFPRAFTEADLPDVVIEMGIGDPAIAGDGERVIHTIDPTPRVPTAASARGVEPPEVTLENLGVVRGDASCTGADCAQGGAGIEHGLPAKLTLQRVALFGNQVSCTGAECGDPFSGAAVTVRSAHDLSISASVVASNRASCAENDCSTGRIVNHDAPGSTDPVTSIIGLTLMTDNVTTCSALDCSADAILRFASPAQDITQTVITDNAVSCDAAGLTCDTDELVQIDANDLELCLSVPCTRLLQDIEVSDNQMRCDGFECNTAEIVASLTTIDHTVERVRFRDNVQQCTGMACDLDEMLDVRALDAPLPTTLAVRTLEFTDNVNGCTGVDCAVDNILQVVGTGASAVSDVFIRGEGQCAGDGCSTRTLANLARIASVDDLTVADSEITCTGVGCTLRSLVTVQIDESTPVTLTEVTLSGNTVTCASAGCGFGSGVNAGNPGEGGILRISTASADIPSRTALAQQLTVTDNVTSARGAVATNLELTIVDSSLTINRGSIDGGAIFNGWVPDPEMPDAIEGGTLTLTNTILDGNTAGQGGSGGRGGGIFNPAGATLRLQGGAIDGNAAASDGGGLWNEGVIAARQNAAIVGNLPSECVDAAGGTGCDLLHTGDFETGDTSFWSAVAP